VGGGLLQRSPVAARQQGFALHECLHLHLIALSIRSTGLVAGPDTYFGKPDYILDKDLADKATAWMQDALAPNKPWFLYYATGTAHAPHHAPKDRTEHSSTRAGTRCAKKPSRARRSLV
jgi:hypothetical protein